MSNAGAASPWIAPEFGNDGGPITATRLEEIQRAAYDEAYASGLQEGRQAGLAEMQERAALLEQLVGQLAEPFRELDESVELALVELASSMATAVVAREIATDPGLIREIVRQAIAVLPVAARSLTLALNPEDSAILREIYASEDGGLKWEIVDVPDMTRGGVEVLVGDSRLDATVEQRLHDIMANLLAPAHS